LIKLKGLYEYNVLIEFLFLLIRKTTFLGQVCVLKTAQALPYDKITNLF